VIVTSLETTLSRTASGKDSKIFCLITFRKLKRIVVIFAKQHQRTKEKLSVQYNESPPQLPQLINVATLPCKMKRSPSHYTKTPKRDKIPQKQKSVSAYCWVVYSSNKSRYIHV